MITRLCSDRTDSRANGCNLIMAGLVKPRQERFSGGQQLSPVGCRGRRSQLQPGGERYFKQTKISPNQLRTGRVEGIQFS